MKRILILGVNGFIGHHLSQRILAATDWEVYGMDMQSERLADVLGIPVDRVSVKAKSPEGLGLVGRREGIAAMAVVSVETRE